MKLNLKYTNVEPTKGTLWVSKDNPCRVIALVSNREASCLKYCTWNKFLRVWEVKPSANKIVDAVLFNDYMYMCTEDEWLRMIGDNCDPLKLAMATLCGIAWSTQDLEIVATAAYTNETEIYRVLNVESPTVCLQPIGGTNALTFYESLAVFKAKYRKVGDCQDVTTLLTKGIAARALIGASRSLPISELLKV